MDLAELILQKAKDIEKDEKSKDFIEYQLIFDIEEKKIIKSFKLYKIKNKIAIEYLNVIWKMICKNKVISLLSVIFRQICKSVILEYNYEVLSNENIYIKIINKGIVIFQDDYFIIHSIDYHSLSLQILNNDIDNDLQELLNMFIIYAKLCIESF